MGIARRPQPWTCETVRRSESRGPVCTVDMPGSQRQSSISAAATRGDVGEVPKGAQDLCGCIPRPHASNGRGTGVRCGDRSGAVRRNDEGRSRRRAGVRAHSEAEYDGRHSYERSAGRIVRKDEEAAAARSVNFNEKNVLLRRDGCAHRDWASRALGGYVRDCAREVAKSSAQPTGVGGLVLCGTVPGPAGTVLASRDLDGHRAVPRAKGVVTCARETWLNPGVA